MTMIRKQLYITPAQQHKLRTLAARRGCSEAEVMRAAIDRLEGDVRSEIDRVLSEAGVLVPPPLGDDEARLLDDEDAQLEAELDAWAATLPQPVQLADAVIEDREAGW
jgi:hypothetical protein